MGALKCQQMTLGWGGGVFKFPLSSIPTEQHDAWVLKESLFVDEVDVDSLSVSLSRFLLLQSTLS